MIVPQTEHWLARHAGAIMAAVMGPTFAYSVIAWANATRWEVTS